MRPATHTTHSPVRAGSRRAPFQALCLVLAVAAVALTASVWAEKPATLTIDFQAMSETAEARYGPDSQPLIDDWRSFLGSLTDAPAKVKLEKVNDFFHRHLTYAEDPIVWGAKDYWATPIETLTEGRGDCEDYAIGKYVSLLNAGVANEHLRLVYVRARIGGPSSPVTRPHMVLAYYPTPSAEPLILDSLVRRILPASERPDLLPVFSFNSERLWIGSDRPSSDSPTSRLSRWQETINRMIEEGISWDTYQ